MKTRSMKKSLIASTALATAMAGGSAMAASAGSNPFATHSVKDSATTQLAEMACGAGQCGGNMKGSGDEAKGKDQDKSKS